MSVRTVLYTCTVYSTGMYSYVPGTTHFNVFVPKSSNNSFNCEKNPCDFCTVLQYHTLLWHIPVHTAISLYFPPYHALKQGNVLLVGGTCTVPVLSFMYHSIHQVLYKSWLHLRLVLRRQYVMVIFRTGLWFVLPYWNMYCIPTSTLHSYSMSIKIKP